ncbi:MAG: PfkB family carbohydrate kinase [marine benthic group bacterium]|nr:PfkB family carbohydrate kinase [Candidatus Benthicola marisminoris]
MQDDKVPPEDPFVTPEEATSFLEKARGGRVLVVGDAMLDVYLAGSVDRVSPEAPVPVVHVESERHAPGGAANVAMGVAALGGTCRLVASVGEDDAAGILAAGLREAGVGSEDLVSVPGRPTTRKTRILARHQQMLRVDREDPTPMSKEDQERLAERALSCLDWADALVIEDYDKGVISGALAGDLLAGARARGIPSVVDPKLRHFFDFAGVTVFKPNARELAAALGLEEAPRDETDLHPLLERLGCECLLLTLGEEGMLLVEASSETRLLPPETREVFDVTGAGDTVTSVLAMCLLAGASLGQAAYIANFAAGIEVARLGAVPVSAADLLAELQRRDR